MLLLGMQLLLPMNEWAEEHWGVWVWWGRHCWGGGFVQQSPPTILPCVVWRGAEIKQRVHSSATSALMSSWKPCIFGLLETTGVPVTELSMMDPKTRAPTSPLPASLWKHMAQNLLRLPRQSQFLFVAPVLLLSSAQLNSAHRCSVCPQRPQEHPETGRRCVQNGTLPKTLSHSRCSSRSR